MELVDSHCHLDMLAAQGVDLSEILERSRAAGVKYHQTICTSMDNFPEILKIAEGFEGVFASLGVHPNEVENIISPEELVNLSSSPKVIGLGETGLDYYREATDKNKQRRSFASHIEAAAVTSLPLIVHTREAEEDTIGILASEYKSKEFKGLIHCFTSSKNLARSMLDIGFYISISGIVTFKNAQNLREVVSFVPMDRLLIETDSPYLAPVPMRGKTNEPSYVRYVAEFIAELKNLKTEEAASVTTKNFFDLFSKAEKIL